VKPIERKELKESEARVVSTGFRSFPIGLYIGHRSITKDVAREHSPSAFESVVASVLASERAARP
jgi:hypothetical protein